MIDDHGSTPPTAPLARPATEAYPPRSINVPALTFGSRRATFDRQLCRRRSPTAWFRNPREQDLIATAAASIDGGERSRDDCATGACARPGVSRSSARQRGAIP